MKNSKSTPTYCIYNTAADDDLICVLEDKDEVVKFLSEIGGPAFIRIEDTAGKTISPDKLLKDVK